MEYQPIMNLEIGGFFAAAISALSSLVQAYKSARAEARAVKQTKIDELEDRASRPLKRGGKGLSQVIDDDVLLALNDDINESLVELVSALSNRTAPEATKNKAVRQAEERICAALSRILMLNQDRFPTKRLKNLWLSHGCEEGEPVVVHTQSF